MVFRTTVLRAVLTSTFIQDHNSDQLTMPCGIIIYNPKIKQTSLLCQLQGYTYWMKECPLQSPSYRETMTYIPNGRVTSFALLFCSH